MIEGFDGYAVAVCIEAVVVLFVGFGLGVTGEKAAEAVEITSAGFAQSVSEGKAQIAPIGVMGGYVGAGGFDAGGNGLNVGIGI